mgnify:CR=1 FL=1
MNIVSLLKIADKSAIFLCFIAKYLIKTYRIAIYNYVCYKKTISEMKNNIFTLKNQNIFSNLKFYV